MTLDVQGDLRALIADVQAHRPERLTAAINRQWAQEGAARLREYVGGGPMTTYLTARSGKARDSVRASWNAGGARLSASGPGMALQEEGGTILPRRGRWLTFRLRQPWDGAEPTGQWIRTRKVKIPARHMVRDAATQALDDLPTFLDFALEA